MLVLEGGHRATLLRGAACRVPHTWKSRRREHCVIITNRTALDSSSVAVNCPYFATLVTYADRKPRHVVDLIALQTKGDLSGQQSVSSKGLGHLSPLPQKMASTVCLGLELSQKINSFLLKSQDRTRDNKILRKEATVFRSWFCVLQKTFLLATRVQFY